MKKQLELVTARLEERERTLEEWPEEDRRTAQLELVSVYEESLREFSAKILKKTP